MTKQSIVSLVIAISFSFQIIAQQSATYTSNMVDYQKALSLYNNQQYQAAQSMFSSVKKTAKEDILQSNCTYYIANCAVRLNQQNADQLVENFVKEYPTSTKRNTAFVDVGDYYFENSKYAYARKWYDKVDEEALGRKEREKFYFNNGYTAFSTKNYKTAKKYLSRVESSPEFGSQAKYYIGFMAYEGDDYDKANEYFDQVSDQERYKEKLSYYQADLNFKLGKFDEAIELAKERLESSDENEVSELSKIIGESYFNLEKYAEAIPYLTEYKGKRGKWNNTDFYQLGYAYYKQKDYEKAISEFNKIVGGNNAIAQNAYYHLGESYINLDKKQEALNAFRNASQMNYDLKIQEDAWLNYAKISYEIGNPYQSAPQVLAGYLEKYPDTSYKEEIETLLIDSYITSKNYKEALKLLESKKINYFSSDFENEFLADYKFDITQIPQNDDTFDTIICYHILEHIMDDQKAMAELYRVLKPNGNIYMQTPFKEGDIYEDDLIILPEERLKHFGQDDHVRIYSVKGLNDRLENCGFNTSIMNYNTTTDNDFYLGLKSPETILIASK